MNTARKKERKKELDNLKSPQTIKTTRLKYYYEFEKRIFFRICFF